MATLQFICTLWPWPALRPMPYSLAILSIAGHPPPMVTSKLPTAFIPWSPPLVAYPFFLAGLQSQVLISGHPSIAGRSPHMVAPALQTTLSPWLPLGHHASSTLACLRSPATLSGRHSFTRRHTHGSAHVASIFLFWPTLGRIARAICGRPSISGRTFVAGRPPSSIFGWPAFVVDPLSPTAGRDNDPTSLPATRKNRSFV